MYRNTGRGNYRDNGYRGQGMRYGDNRRQQYGQAPRRQFNPRPRREGVSGWGNRGGFQRPRGRGISYNRSDNWRRNQGNQIKGPKRRYNDENYRSTKRQRTSYCYLPLTSIILAQPGDKTGNAPKLVLSSFYDCKRDAKLCKDKFYLELNISRKDKSARRSIEDRVSIPVPLDNIESVGVLSGMNPFEEMIGAHYERIELHGAIENLNAEILRQNEKLEKITEELNSLPVIEEVDDDYQGEDKVVIENDGTAQEQPVQVGLEGMSDLPQVEDVEAQNQEPNEQEKIKQQEELERTRERERKRKEREQQIANKERIENSVKHMEELIVETKQKLAETEQKLSTLFERFGEELKWFEDGTEGAEDAFLAELQQNMGTVVSGESEEMNDAQVCAGEQMTDIAEPTELVAEQQSHCEVNTHEGLSSENPIDLVQPVEGVLPTPLQNQEISQGMETSEVVNDVEMRTFGLPTVTEKPVRILIILKSPLEKFYASNTKTTICSKEAIEQTTMIIMECDFKQSSEENLKLVNDTLGGPWKDICKSNEQLLMNPFSADKTMQYLVKCHVKQEVYDTTVVSCHLCGNRFRRMVMETHQKQFCLMREEPCKYCEKVLVYKDMKNHHEGDCPRYIVQCPQRCYKKNLERCKIEEHLSTCMNSVVDCRYKSYGCKAQVKRRNESKHKYDGVTGHLDLLEERMELLTNYLLKQNPNLHEVLYPPVKQDLVIISDDEDMAEGDDQTGTSGALPVSEN